MTKLRRDQQVVYRCQYVGGYSFESLLIVLPGGPYLENNRTALRENMERMYGGEWRVTPIYHWRTHRHLTRWLRDPNKKSFIKNADSN